VAQFAQQILQVIVELQGWLPSTPTLILGLHQLRYKRLFFRCPQYVHSPAPVLWYGPRSISVLR
jgi:hypothetical protein